MTSKNPTRLPAILMLEDGSIYHGYGVGLTCTSGGEICFNTGMTGYQEIYTDPSYYGQIVVNTAAHIGNYGAHNKENESNKAQVKGIVVNEFSFPYSRPSANQPLHDFLISHNTVGIGGIDTRKLVRHIRKVGAMNAVISSETFDTIQLRRFIEDLPNMASLELSSIVTCDAPYLLGENNTKFKVAVLDLGVKKSILNHLVQRDCQLKVFPAKTSFNEMQKWKPDGYFISNGPGDPAAMDYAVATVKQIVAAEIPLFGICLGNQLLALSVGIGTHKMHHGHRGLNHPVKNLLSGASEITSQNHGFAVNYDELIASEEAKLTHIDLNDKTVEGLRLVNKPAFSVQYHPESSPGPHDSHYLFDDFIQLIKKHKS